MGTNKTDENQGKTFTQEELDAILGERIARERAKYSDYNDLKEKAAKFDEYEEATKSDLQKATERVAELEAQITARDEAERREATISRIASEYQVPDEYRTLLTASDEDGLTSQAKLLTKKFADESLNDGRKPAEIDAPRDEMDDFFDALSTNVSNRI